YVANLPLPKSDIDGLRQIGDACIDLKRRLVSTDPLERVFDPYGLLVPLEGSSSSVLPAVSEKSIHGEALASLLHSLEGLNERLVCEAYELDDDDVRAVIEETGVPAGWHPLVTGYDERAAGFSEPEIPETLKADFERLERRTLSPSELSSLKERLKML